MMDVYNVGSRIQELPSKYRSSAAQKRTPASRAEVDRRHASATGTVLPERPAKVPDYPETLVAVRQIIKGFIATSRVDCFYRENVARVHGLDPGYVQRALGDLRREGLVHRPVRRTPPCETRRGHGYDEYSAWSPTRYFVRLLGYELHLNKLSGPSGHIEHILSTEVHP